MEQHLPPTTAVVAVPSDTPATVPSFIGPGSPRAMQERLERILLGDQELLISLHCQLEQIRREIRLLNDDRIVRALVDEDQAFRH